LAVQEKSKLAGRNFGGFFKLKVYYLAGVLIASTL